MFKKFWKAAFRGLNLIITLMGLTNVICALTLQGPWWLELLSYVGMFGWLLFIYNFEIDWEND